MHGAVSGSDGQCVSWLHVCPSSSAGWGRGQRRAPKTQGDSGLCQEGLLTSPPPHPATPQLKKKIFTSLFLVHVALSELMEPVRENFRCSPG